MPEPDGGEQLEQVVVIGAGLAGFSAADELRKSGFAGAIVLIDREPASYDRPPLSKDLFNVDFALSTLTYRDVDRFAADRIECRFGRTVDVLDLGDEDRLAQVRLDDGEVLRADKVLLATGGRPRVLPIPGADDPRVLSLRDFADADALRAAVRPGTRLLVIGAGLIGAELAASAATHGALVTLLDPSAVPLLPAVGELMAGHLHGMHTDRGLTVRVGQAASIDSSADAMHVTTSDGAVIDADVVLVGIGIIPSVQLAQTAGLEVDNGVIVDDQQRSSSPRVWAAGDVARRRRSDGELERREEHWEAAELSGRAAARSMLELPIRPHGAPWFWSDRHGIHLEAVGRLSGPGEVIVREGAHPAVFLVHDGLLAGAASVDDANAVRAARRLIDQRIAVDPAALADPSVSLRSLLRKAG